MELMPHQKDAIEKLHSGSILCGGVGTGKSCTALGYFYNKECFGDISRKIPIKYPKDLYIITTARKRDTGEWDYECAQYGICTDHNLNPGGLHMTIDSWNNIKKYTNVKDAFFIFDEQRVVGKGAWVTSFLKIAKQNHWILLSATPGDTWTDYIPVFIANGYYHNRTEFMRRHVVFDSYVKFPKIKSYLDTQTLSKIRSEVVVYMSYKKAAKKHESSFILPYDKVKYDKVVKNRWNPYKNEPIRNASEYFSVLRRIINTTSDKPGALSHLMTFGNIMDNLGHIPKKAIIFYNFDYELKELVEYAETNHVLYSQWNGHKHEPVPTGDEWIYLVQYTSGCEGWNCVETDTIIFYSLNYSCKVMTQAAGRIDRLNTKYDDLYYYYFKTDSQIDKSIQTCLEKKWVFNESAFAKELWEDVNEHKTV